MSSDVLEKVHKSYFDLDITWLVTGEGDMIRGDMEDGVIIASARVSATNTVRIKFVNATAGAVDPAAVNFDITVVQP